jgi:hypothetical protein
MGQVTEQMVERDDPRFWARFLLEGGSQVNSKIQGGSPLEARRWPR